jgi:hypothetical protein
MYTAKNKIESIVRNFLLAAEQIGRNLGRIKMINNHKKKIHFFKNMNKTIRTVRK